MPSTPAAPRSGAEMLSIALPEAIGQAVENYLTLALGDVPSDAKAFQQHQAACKAALAHIEALIKLSASQSGGTMVGDEAADDLVRRAEAAFDAYRTAAGNTIERCEEENGDD